MKISVVIVAYNPRKEYLERVVQSIVNQSIPRSAFEFLVVDNNSVPPIRDYSLIKRQRIKVIVEKRQGLTAGRDCAWRHADGDIVVFVDDDNVLASNYLSVASELMRDPHIGILSGQVEPEYEIQPDPWFERYEERIAVRRFPSEGLFLTSIPQYSNYFPIGAGAVVRRSILKRYFEGLSEENRIEGRLGNSLSSAEDLDLDFFAISKGYLIGSSTKLRCRHLIPPVRTTVHYIINHSESSLKSTFHVNRKWKGVFGRNVYHLFDSRPLPILIKIAFFAVFSFVKRFRISFHSNIMLYRLLRSI